MNNSILSKVFGWMFVGLLVTFLTGYVVSINPNMVVNIFGGFSYIILIILELGLAIYLTARISKMSSTTAKICFIGYAFLSGLTFSSIFIVYEVSSILYVFLITGVLFGVFALIGKYTKINLLKFGTYLFMALIAILVLTIINLFIQSETFNLVLCIIGVLIFLGYIAYDIQHVNALMEANALDEDNLAIYGAFQLYLDFINLFIRLLRLFGNSRDN